MPNAMDMTTAATAAARLNVSSADAALPGLIAAASSALAEYLGYVVYRRTDVEETAAGQGGRYLWLEGGAIQSLTSIVVGGSTVGASLYALDGRDGARKGRVVARGSHSWPFTGEWTAGISATPFRAYDTGAIVVTFTSGWVTPGQVALAAAEDPPRTLTSDMPPELEQAVIEVVTAWYSDKGKDTRVTSISTGDAAVGWGGDSLQGGRAALPLPARAMAEPYRKHKRRTL